VKKVSVVGCLFNWLGPLGRQGNDTLFQVATIPASNQQERILCQKQSICDEHPLKG